MTPNYEDTPSGPPKKPGMPGWAWALIGCAIIAPLVLVLGVGAVMFPVFAQAREKARQVSCLSNCKQMGMAAIMYAQDHDETMPPKGAKWMDLQKPYLISPMDPPTSTSDRKDIFRCPSYAASPFGYAMSTEPLGKKLGKLTEPATVTLLFDSNVSGPNALAAPEAVAYRHVGHGNMTFADGHARSMKDRTK